MKICVISSTILTCPPMDPKTGKQNYGGLELIAWQLAKGLGEKGHQVLLVAPHGSIVTKNVELHGTTLRESEQQAYSGYWQKLLEQDVIIDHSWQKFSYILKMEGKLKAPILGVLHAPINTMYNSAPPVDKPCFVAISKDQAENTKKHLKIDTRVAYNCVDLDFYKPLGLKRNNRYLFLARMSTIKGPDIAVAVAKKCKAQLDLVGDDTITGEPQYVNQIKEQCNLIPGLRYIGPQNRDECLMWFNKNKALLHPNKHFCHLPGQRIVTDYGTSPIEKVKEYDKVLSHDGTFNTVVSTTERNYDGEICIIQHSSFQGRVKVTPDHPLYVVKPKVCACMGESSGCICKPTYGGYERCKELRNETIAKQEKYDKVLSEYNNGKNYIQLAKEYNISETTTYYWTRGKITRPERNLELPYCDFYEPSWINAKDIEVGDLLVTPVPKSVDRDTIEFDGKTIELTPDFLSLCGWYIAEGYENNKSAKFALNIKEDEYANEIKTKVRNVFDVDTYIYPREKDNSQTIATSRKKNKIGLVMKELFGAYAPIKKMPNWMFLLPPEKLKHVIKSGWKGDGCKSKRGKYEYLSYTTASPTLAMQLWLSLTKFGIFGYLVEKIASAKCKNAGKLMYNLNVSGDYADKLAEVIGWKYRDARSNKAWKGLSFIHNNLIYSRVTSINKENYNGFVYNMSVENSHSYIAQLIGSHNCEPFGLAPVEAQSSQMAVIAFNNGAMRETIKDNETGFLVKSEEEMEELIMNNRVNDIKPERCREWASQFSVENMVKRYEELCIEAINTGW